MDKKKCKKSEGNRTEMSKFEKSVESSLERIADSIEEILNLIEISAKDEAKSD